MFKGYRQVGCSVEVLICYSGECVCMVCVIRNCRLHSNDTFSFCHVQFQFHAGFFSFHNALT